MMTTTTTGTGTAMAAGKRDLTAAVDRIHTEHGGMLLAAGDEVGRETFFDHDESQAPRRVRGRQVSVELSGKTALPDYRTAENLRTHRSMITIPPKVRENIRKCFGAELDSEFPMTTAIVALADYAAWMLRRDGKCLIVHPAQDSLADQRKAARKAVRQASEERAARAPAPKTRRAKTSK